MKLLFPTMRFAGKPMIQFHYGQEGCFFAGEEPPIPSLLALELPELNSQKHTEITKWLIAHNRAAKKTTKEDTSIPRALWRRAVLDDFIDAANAQTYVWHVSMYFTLAEIATFAETHGPTLDGEIRAALDVERSKLPRALSKVGKRADTILPVITAAQRRIPMELEAIKVALDREDLAKLFAAKVPVAGWIAACADLRSTTMQHELVEKIAQRLVDEDGDVGVALDQMLAKGLDKLYQPALFTILEQRIPLPQNLSGATLDLTKAREVTVPGDWNTYKARRVGPVKIGRSALMLITTAGSTHTITYVRGERKLKHRIKARGGSIHRWDNTLTIGAKDPSSAHAALLRVDEIDSLAQLAPARAVALLGDTPVTTPITTALANAATDPRWRRILADLLIEHIVGIDADVARRLARAEARANRK